MKGISLPVNAIVIIAIAILVLTVVAAFFVGGVGPGMQTITLEQAFTKGCDSLVRGNNCDKTKISSIIVTGYPATGDTIPFNQVCAQKGYDIDSCARACGCSDIVMQDTCVINGGSCKPVPDGPSCTTVGCVDGTGIGECASGTCCIC